MVGIPSLKPVITLVGVGMPVVKTEDGMGW